jgi:hypothetical protein
MWFRSWRRRLLPPQVLVLVASSSSSNVAEEEDALSEPEIIMHADAMESSTVHIADQQANERI